MDRTPNTALQRKTASTTVPVHPLLAERWSPRGFDRAHEIGDEALSALLEAARWAPSAGNALTGVGCWVNRLNALMLKVKPGGVRSAQARAVCSAGSA